MKLYDDLVWRGLIKDITSPDLEEKLNAGGMTFYIGTDPSSDSMHIGHLSSFLITKRLKEAGHNPIILLGGSTGLIGDPRPSSERQMISKESLEQNTIGLKEQVEKLFGFKVVNNYDWTKDISTIDFLRDYGKYFNINYMLDKDIIRRRLDSGITYTEFSYMILQALDFLYLYETENCTMQVAGSDQWGNITAGVDLIRKKLNKVVYGFTMPLVTDKYGNKFGKSEGNALWIDKNKTSSYEIYQYFVNSDDEKVLDYLKVFTFLTKEEIEAIMLENGKAPEKRFAAKRLAFEVVKFIHSEEDAIMSQKKAEEIFSNKGLSESTPLLTIDNKEIKDSISVIDLLVKFDLFTSKSEARRMIEQGGISINENKITDINYLVTKKELEKIIVLKKGKKNYYRITIN